MTSPRRSSPGATGPLVRRRAAEGLAFLGIGLDHATNDAAEPVDRDISSDGTQARTFVIEARFEAVIGIGGEDRLCGQCYL